MFYRLHPSQKVRTSSSVTNSENLQHSTVLFVMMRTKLAKIAVKLVIENMTAQNSATSLQTSFVVFVEMQAIWLGIAQTG